MGSKAVEKKTVLVTGFGPFSGHDVNASWVSVQELNKLGVGDNVNLIIKEIPVEYQTVQTLVPQLWQQHKPHLVIHVGVSHLASELVLEQGAHNDGYDRLDVCNKCPETKCCVEGSENYIKSGLNMQHICSEMNNQPIKIKSVVSHDAGRYLCDFSYYQSLHLDSSKAAFIHVPPLNSPYTAAEIAEGLKAVILSMLNCLS